MKNKPRDAVFQLEFREDLIYWIKQDRKIALKAFELIEAIMRDPFKGIGKPEPLKYLDSGTWSRRLTQEHRIVYLVSDSKIDFLNHLYVVFRFFSLFLLCCKSYAFSTNS